MELLLAFAILLLAGVCATLNGRIILLRKDVEYEKNRSLLLIQSMDEEIQALKELAESQKEQPIKKYWK